MISRPRSRLPLVHVSRSWEPGEEQSLEDRRCGAGRTASETGPSPSSPRCLSVPG